jgi:hypothetical protein
MSLLDLFVLISIISLSLACLCAAEAGGRGADPLRPKSQALCWLDLGGCDLLEALAECKELGFELRASPLLGRYPNT